MIPLAIQQSKPTHSFCWQPQTRLVSLFQWKCGWNMLKTRQDLAICLTETDWYRVFCTLPYFSIISPLSSVFLWAPIPFWSKHKLIPRWVSFPFLSSGSFLEQLYTYPRFSVLISPNWELLLSQMASKPNLTLTVPSWLHTPCCQLLASYQVLLQMRRLCLSEQLK